MGGLLHLVQQEGTGWDRSPPRPLLAVPNVIIIIIKIIKIIII